MNDYKENGKVIEITLDSGKVVKVATDWVTKAMSNLDLSMEDTLLMWLEDNDYLENQEQEELDKAAKANKPKVQAKSSGDRKQVVRERKPNPTKENIIKKVAETLETFATDVNIENIGKIITFKVENKEFKLDLTEKRVKKQ
jgi:hypothetical protein